MKHTTRMKTVKLRSSILAGFTILLLLFPWFGSWKTLSLKDITKPYLGVYECHEAKLGEEDCLQNFDYIRLELKRKGLFVLSYQTKGGESKEEKGRYEYEKETQSIIFQAEAMPFIKRQFPLKEGKLIIIVSLGGKNLKMRFEQS